VQSADPVGIGLVKTLARPGGNATGFINFTDAIVGKQLELLREVNPDFDTAFRTIEQERPDALHVFHNTTMWIHQQRIIAFAAAQRLLAVYGEPRYVQSGGLMSYSYSAADLYRRSTGYVDRILKGAKPADLPVQQPTKLDLAVNLKTAKALGITIPQSVSFRADSVIQ
jgi:putative ABC transport system substrate-binding protein